MQELRYYEAERIPYWRWRWWVGLPRPFWAAKHFFIGRFIKEHGLKPIDQRDLVWDDPVPIAPIVDALPVEEARQIRWPRPFPGGLRFAHVHHGSELYALDREQWKVFSQEVMETVRDRITQAETVGFADLIELSDAVDALP